MIRKHIAHCLFVLAFLLTPMLVLGQQDSAKTQQVAEAIAKFDSIKAEMDRHRNEQKRLMDSLNKSEEERYQALNNAYEELKDLLPKTQQVATSGAPAYSQSQPAKQGDEAQSTDEASTSNGASTSDDAWPLSQILLTIGVVLGVLGIGYFVIKGQRNESKNKRTKEDKSTQSAKPKTEKAKQNSAQTSKSTQVVTSPAPASASSAGQTPQAPQTTQVATSPASASASSAGQTPQAPQTTQVVTSPAPTSASSAGQAPQSTPVETAPAPAPSKSYYFEVALPSGEQGRLQGKPSPSYYFVIAEDGSFDLAPGLSDEQKGNLIRNRGNTGLVVIEGFGDNIRVESKGQLNINQTEMKWVLKTPLRLKKFE